MGGCHSVKMKTEPVKSIQECLGKNEGKKSILVGSCTCCNRRIYVFPEVKTYYFVVKGEGPLSGSTVCANCMYYDKMDDIT